jgi:hypothetical protein
MYRIQSNSMRHNFVITRKSLEKKKRKEKKRKEKKRKEKKRKEKKRKEKKKREFLAYSPGLTCIRTNQKHLENVLHQLFPDKSISKFYLAFSISNFSFLIGNF